MGATGAAVLGPERIDQDLDLGHCVQVDVLSHAVGLADLIAQHAVDGDVVPVPAHSADLRDQRPEALAQRLDGVLVAHAGDQPHERGDVAPLRLHLLDLL